MKATILTTYDPAEDLADPESQRVFLDDALQTGDAGYIANAIGVVARAKGLANIADETGLSRQSLYRSLKTGGNPTLRTTLAVFQSLGLQLSTKPASPEGHA